MAAVKAKTPATKKAEKKSRFKWEPWLTGLNQDKIRRHWMAHPDDDIGTVVVVSHINKNATFIAK